MKITVSKKNVWSVLSAFITLFFIYDALPLIWAIYLVILVLLFVILKRRLMFLTSFFITVLVCLFCMTPILDALNVSYGTLRRLVTPAPKPMYEGTMKEAPVISIVMPAYNYEKFVKRALDSAATQDFNKPYEVVIVEDGSKDKTLDVLLNEAKKYPHVRVYANAKNRGLITTKNSAVALAKGELIFNLDADDWIDEDALSLLYNTMEESKADLVYTWFIKETDHGSEIPVQDDVSKLWKNHIPNTILYRKSDWQKYHGYSYLFAKGLEDWNFWLNFARDGKSIVRTSKPVYHYYIKENSRQDALNKEGGYDRYYRVWWLLQIWHGYRYGWDLRWLFTYVGFKKDHISQLSTMLETREIMNP